MTRVVLIKAGPTPWDAEKRIAGNQPLPLTEEGRTKLSALVEKLPKIDAVYRCKSHDACDEIARLVASRNNLKPRDSEHLDAWNLGLWQGLRFEDLEQRYPSVMEQWQDSPTKIVPPEGESFIDAIARLHDAMKKILRRNKGYTIALAVRPSALHIIAGILRRETPEQIASHLQNDTPMETIELGDDVLKAI
jgi:broad specificity phosphatase PhoE